MKQTFIYSDEKSNKFWTIEITGNSFTVNYGKTGTDGQTQIKEFADNAACQKAAEKLIAEKTKKGYAEEQSKASPIQSSQSVKENNTNNSQDSAVVDKLKQEIFATLDSLNERIVANLYRILKNFDDDEDECRMKEPAGYVGTLNISITHVKQKNKEVIQLVMSGNHGVVGYTKADSITIDSEALNQFFAQLEDKQILDEFTLNIRDWVAGKITGQAYGGFYDAALDFRLIFGPVGGNYTDRTYFIKDDKRYAILLDKLAGFIKNKSYEGFDELDSSSVFVEAINLFDRLSIDEIRQYFKYLVDEYGFNPLYNKWESITGAFFEDFIKREQYSEEDITHFGKMIELIFEMSSYIKPKFYDEAIQFLQEHNYTFQTPLAGEDTKDDADIELPKETKIEKQKEKPGKEKPVATKKAPKAEIRNLWINDKKIWGYHTLDECDFDIANLKDPNYVEDTGEKSEDEAKKEKGGGLTQSKLMTLYKENRLDNVIVKAAGAGNMEHLLFAYEAAEKEFKKEEEKFGKRSYSPKDYLEKALRNILNFYDAPYTENTAKVVQWLLEKGAKLEKNTGDDYLGKNFTTEYLKDPRPERVSGIFETYIDQKFKSGFEDAIQILRTDLDAIRNNKEVKEYTVAPNGKCPENFVGFEIKLVRPWGNEYLHVDSLDIENKHICRLFNKHLSKGVLGAEVHKYLQKYFVPGLEKIAKDGLFDGLFESGIIMFTEQGYDEPLFIHITRPGIKEEFESFLKHLETSDNWAENTGMVPVAFYLLIKGALGKKDEERAYRLVEKYLYNCDIYREARNLLSWMIRVKAGYPKMNYLIAKWRIINKNLDQANSYIQEIQKTDTKGAEELKRLLAVEKTKVEILKKPTVKTDAYVPGFDIKAAASKWENAKFEQVFTDENLFLETEHIMARARTNGNIYIRFIKEDETAYGEALDFINSLLEKGYAYLSGGANKSDGYAIKVWFLEQPVFVDEVVKIKNAQIGSFPKTTCHAFFACAVQYPALREKVVAYIERAVNKYSWYMDIQNESNTLPGTFAVAALMLCDKKYLPLVSLFANNVDSEHMYTQLSFPMALVNHYGNDTGLAPALYDLSVNAGFDKGPSKISGDLLYNAQFVEKMLNYSKIEIDDESGLEYFGMAMEYLYGDKGKSNLKKIRDAVSNTKDEHEKAVYTKFHNVYLQALKSGDDEEYGKIKPIGSATGKDAEIKPESLKDQDAVISLEEAEKRSYPHIGNHWDSTMMFFSPALVTDPETVRYIKQQWKHIGLGTNDHYKMIARNGPFCLRFGDWVVNSKDLKYECGMVIANRETKPMILYGEIDVPPIWKQFDKKWYQEFTLVQMEKIRQTHLIRESKLRNDTELWRQQDESFDSPAAAYYSNWFLHTAKIVLQKIDKTKPESYLSSRIMLAHLAEIDADIKLMRELYTELISLQPQEKGYWDKKMESIADK